MNKYTYTNVTIPAADGGVLRQIVATSNFTALSGNITTGTVGGYIQGDNNLQRTGGCWLTANATAQGNAQIRDNALVTGNATLTADVTVSSNATVGGFAVLTDKAAVGGTATVNGYTQMFDRSKVLDAAIVTGTNQTYLMDSATVKGNANITGNLIASGNSVVTGFVTTDVNATVVVRDNAMADGSYVAPAGVTVARGNTRLTA